MGGAQPLAATFAGACSLNVECQQSRIDFRLRTRYLDEQADRVWTTRWPSSPRHTARGQARCRVGPARQRAEVLPEMVRRAQAGGPRPDLVTDQTSRP